MYRIERGNFDALLLAIKNHGYTIVGPTIRDGAIVYDAVNHADDLPIGWTDEQEAGTYRLKQRNDQALFGYVLGPYSWKKFLFPPTVRLFSARRTADGFELEYGSPHLNPPSSLPPPPYAFVGVRSCELHALAIQDKIFSGGEYIDPFYKSLRKQSLIIAVNCGQAGGTCFCVSMQTGPRATKGFDLSLTEVIIEIGHFFVVEVGTDRGSEILRKIPHQPATDIEIEAAERVVQIAADEMGRWIDTDGIKELLYENFEHPRWDEVANRCLTCANCTMVCPTCFCSTVEDVTDLTGDHAERWRRWDSCFTMDFSYIHGGSIRPSVKARYRQWMTHKLASWIDQFGMSGCVGCGRCITWCPVGIDITEEVNAIRESDAIERMTTSAKEDHNGNP